MIKGTETNFEANVSEGDVLVDYWASWCGPCKMMEPVLDKLEEKHGLTVLKVNVDEEPELARNARIMSIPTLVLYRNGEAVKTIVGAKPQSILEKELGLD